MSGPFVSQHKDEILDLIREMANGMEQKNHRERAIRIAGRPAVSLKVTFANAQLARDIGRSLQQKYMGELDVQVEAGGNIVRVNWWR